MNRANGLFGAPSREVGASGEFGLSPAASRADTGADQNDEQDLRQARGGGTGRRALARRGGRRVGAGVERRHEDMSSAGNTNGGGLPQVQQQGDVSYTSGGVGLDESKAFCANRRTGRSRCASPVRRANICPVCACGSPDSHGSEVLGTEAMGPYMLVKLRPGQYTVYAKYKDQEQKKAVSVQGAGKAKTGFHWSIQ